jgi:hypothetical protein
MAQKRRMKKADVEVRETNDYDEEFQPLTIAILPGDVLKLVMSRWLGPHDLARASCVSRTWRECSEGAWRAACVRAFGEDRCETVRRQGGGVDGSSSSAAAGGAAAASAAAAAAATATTASAATTTAATTAATAATSAATTTAATTAAAAAAAAAAATPTAAAAAAAATSWRLTFLAARRRWPALALEPTGRVFCTSCRMLLWEAEQHSWPRACKNGGSRRVKSRSRGATSSAIAAGGGGGGGGGGVDAGAEDASHADTAADTRGSRGQGRGAVSTQLCLHTPVRFPALRVVGYLRSGRGSDSDSSDSGDDSDSDSSGGGGGGGSGSGEDGGGGGGGRGRHRLWRIPTG